MKKFNKKIFLTAASVAMLLTFISWIAIWQDDTHNRFNSTWRVLRQLAYVVRFPTHTLFWNFLIRHDNIIYYIGGLLINCFFYGFFIERIFSFFNKKKRKFPPVPTGI